MFQVPFDGQRLVFPPVAAAVFAAFFLWILTMLLPVGISRAVWSGGVLGYVGYDMLHYYFHHGTPERGTYLHSLKYYHVLHHFDDHSTGTYVYPATPEIQKNSPASAIFENLE